jgi:hypothetical protein
LSNGGTSANKIKPPNGPASSKQKPSDVKQTEVSDEEISDDKEAPEPVTTEPEKLSGVSSKKSRKLGASTESKATKRSKVVSDDEGLDASGELSADDTPKPVDSTPAVDKPKRGRPAAVKSQEKKAVGKSQGSGLESKEVRSGSTSGGRPVRRLAKDIKLSPKKTGEEESSKKQPKGSSNLRKEDTLSDEDTDEDLNSKVIFSLQPFRCLLFHIIHAWVLFAQVSDFCFVYSWFSCLCDFAKLDGWEATHPNLQNLESCNVYCHLLLGSFELFYLLRLT